MRVISGELRGRRFRAPDGIGTRPMLDRVREAIFSRLSPWLPGARVLDLFAGSGAMSIEALSRGAVRARLVESDRGVRALELANLVDLGLADRADVVAADALAVGAAEGDPYDIVFCDPPFPLIEARESRRGVLDAVARIARANLAPEGVIVLHVPARALLEHEFAADLSTHERVYGAQSIWFVQPTPQEPPPDGR
jgi:16S rRNA (guanine966-N2)-methyltransferase